MCSYVCVCCFAVPARSKTPAAQHRLRKPLSQCDPPVFISDDDSDDDIVVKSTWRTRHSKPPQWDNALLCNKDDSSAPLPFSSPFCPPPHKTLTSLANPKRTLSAPSKLDDSASSEEEFMSLLERLKKKNILTGSSFSPRNNQGNCFLGRRIPTVSGFCFYLTGEANTCVFIFCS